MLNVKKKACKSPPCVAPSPTWGVCRWERTHARPCHRSACLAKKHQMDCHSRAIHFGLCLFNILNKSVNLVACQTGQSCNLFGDVDIISRQDFFLRPTPPVIQAKAGLVVVFKDAAECQELWARHVVVQNQISLLTISLKFCQSVQNQGTL